MVFRSLIYGKTGRASTRIAAGLAIAAGAAALVRRFIPLSWLSLHFPYPLDYGEGAVLDVAARLADFQNIYPRDLHAPPWFVANYPPVYYAVRAAAIWIDGPALWHGRAISQLSAVVCAASIGLVIRRLTNDTLAAAVGAIAFLGIPFVAAWAQYDRVDLLALALTWLGLWTVSRPDGPVGAAAGCFVASSFTRQTGAIAGVAAAYLWLARQRGFPAANRLLFWTAAPGLLLLLAIQAASGGGFWFHVVTGTVGRMSATQLVNLGRQPIELMPLLLACGAAATIAPLRWRPSGWFLIAPYTIVAALLALTVAKEGSYINYFLDLSAACSLAAGACVGWLRPYPRLRAALLVVLALQFAGMARSNTLYNHLDARLRRSNEYARLSRIVRDAGGPVLADEPMALIPLAGRRVELHPFAMTQLATAGLWDESPFLQQLTAQHFPVILLRIPAANPRILRNLWTDRMSAAITDHYIPTESIPVDDSASIVVYVPKVRR